MSERVLSRPGLQAHDEAALLARVRGGDRSAFEDLLRPHEGRLYNAVLRITGNPAEAADVYQDAVLAAFEKLDGFRGDAAFGTWLHRIAINYALMKRRAAAATSTCRADDRASNRSTGGKVMSEQSCRVDIEEAVRRRYSEGAREPEPALCCPTAYDPKLLTAIPEEVLERDYGCGDPSRYLERGETVLDLGSGSGKVCFLASQVVGPAGRVIGVDMNDDMLEIARRNAPEVARRIGHANVEFRKAKIQDLGLDLTWLDGVLREQPVRSEADLARLEARVAEQRRLRPLVADQSIDVVVSNCVLNLVRAEDKRQLFGEIFRVLRRGGRAVISDIVSDEDVPEALQSDPELWSGCISGALREDLLLAAFEDAGFYGVTLLDRQADPWRVLDGIELRSVTVAAFKGKEGPCRDQKHAVVYRGPFRQVEDDDGHVLRRGVRTAVCEKTFRIYSREPYRAHLELILPRVLLPLDQAPPFPCSDGPMLRHPAETKGKGYRATSGVSGNGCGPNGSKGGGCC